LQEILDDQVGVLLFVLGIKHLEEDCYYEACYRIVDFGPIEPIDDSVPLLKELFHDVIFVFLAQVL
jgi:hypothetical protein